MIQRVVTLCALSLLFFASSSTPQKTQAVSSTVVISEFRTRGPNGGNDEFIELYNLSSSPVNISGWQIRGLKRGWRRNDQGDDQRRCNTQPGLSLSAHQSELYGRPLQRLCSRQSDIRPRHNRRRRHCSDRCHRQYHRSSRPERRVCFQGRLDTNTSHLEREFELRAQAKRRCWEWTGYG